MKKGRNSFTITIKLENLMIAIAYVIAMIAGGFVCAICVNNLFEFLCMFGMFGAILIWSVIVVLPKFKCFKGECLWDD